jgi:N-acetylneuraminic acid mutarotase
MAGKRLWGFPLVWLGLFGGCETQQLMAAESALQLTVDEPSPRSWAQAPLIPAYTAPVMATVHTKLNLFGSSDELERNGTLDTWEWYAGAWTRKQPLAAPGDRLLPGLARYGDTLVMFGGFTSTDYFYDGLATESWQWNGRAWQQLSLPTTPPGRYQVGLATLGKSVIMFGGQDATSTRNDTWIYTWRDWVEQTGAAGPSNCASPVAVLGSTALLFCGATDAADHLGHTWLWDGTRWNERQTATRPSSRYSQLLASFDGRIVMYGGYADSGNWQETWEWDGNDWHDRSVLPSPPPRDGYQMIEQGGELVLFGGGESATWTWDGARWDLAQPATMPAQRRDYSIATLGDRAIVFGGCCKHAGAGAPEYWDDTWAWDGRAWTELQPARRPPPRAASRLAALGGDLVLFGGIGQDGLLDDTWVFDGVTWSERTPSVRPAARQHHAMAAYAGKLYVFGGASTPALRSDLARNDMWQWDGSQWRPVASAGTAMVPGPSYQSAMASYADKLALFEAARSRLWLWDGSAWTLGSDDWGLSPLSSTPIYLVELPLGAAGSRLLVAGTSFQQFVSREWDGSAWSNPSPLGLANLGAIAAYGDSRGSLVSLAGWPLRTWTYASR